MKLEKWALIAEIVGAVAIVVTLIFLIVEVRGNTEAIRAANRQSLATRAQEMALTLATEPDLRRAIAETNGVEVPGPDDGFVTANLRIAEEAYLLYLDGQLSEDYWQTRAAVALDGLRSATLRNNYESLRDRGFFTSEFTAWLDQALSESYED